MIGVDEPIVSQTKFIVTNGVLEAQDYRFIMRAKNQWGWGAFSPVAVIRASTFPNIVSSIVTSYDSVTGGFKIQWAQPRNNGDVITQYKIEILSTSGNWNADIIDCNGADSNVVVHTECIISLNSLYASPNNLVFQQFVKVRI